MKVKLKDIFSIERGGSPRPISDFITKDEDGINWIKIGDVKKGQKYIYKTKQKIRKEGLKKSRLVKEGDFILSNSMSFGRPYIVKTEGAIHDGWLLLRSKSDNISKDYFYYLLGSNYMYRQFAKKASGAVVKNLNINIVQSISVPLPSLPQQKAIAKKLDKAQELIELRKSSIKKLDDLSKALFVDMFGDPVENEMGWEIKTLKELSTHILSGTTPKGGSQVYVKKGILFFRSQNVWKNKILLDNIAYIDNETHLKMKKSSLKYKDILITKTGRFNTENSSLGRASLFLGEDDSANINGHVYLVRLEKSMIHEFVLYILTTNEYRDYIRSVCVGGIDKRQINKSHVEEFPIILPPLPLQQKFAKTIEKIEAQKALYEEELKGFEELFASLLSESFA